MLWVYSYIYDHFFGENVMRLYSLISLSLFFSTTLWSPIEASHHMRTRDLKLDAPVRPTYEIVGDKSCIKKIEFIPSENESNDKATIRWESPRQHYVVTYQAPCHAKLDFFWLSSPNETNQKYDGYARVNLAEE